jgi:hypothetical protein
MNECNKPENKKEQHLTFLELNTNECMKQIEEVQFLFLKDVWDYHIGKEIIIIG